MAKESLLEIATKGAQAGLVATAAITGSLMTGAALMALRGDQSLTDLIAEQNSPNEKLAYQLVDQTAYELTDAGRFVGGQIFHWSYGASWGVLYGILQSKLNLPHRVHGTLLALIVGGIAFTVVPALKLAPPVKDRAPEKNINQAISYFVYGWVTALVFHRLSGGDKKN